MLQIDNKYLCSQLFGLKGISKSSASVHSKCSFNIELKNRLEQWTAFLRQPWSF